MGYLRILANESNISELVLLGHTSFLFRSEFKKAYITDCKFVNINILNCNFDSAWCGNTDFSETTFDGGSYKWAHIDNCDFCRAQFYSCIFVKTYFSDCNFRKASFGNCSFINCTFENCDLGFGSSRTPDFYGGEIKNCVNVPPIPMACPENGEFIGYKKAIVGDEDNIYTSSVIVKLKIPAKAKRSSALGRKCRCSEAKVVAIYDITRARYAFAPGPAEFVKERGIVGVDSVWRKSLGKELDPYVVAYSKFANRVQGLSQVRYKVGETVRADKWDDDRFNECSHGIHFFTNLQDALDY